MMPSVFSEKGGEIAFLVFRGPVGDYARDERPGVGSAPWSVAADRINARYFMNPPVFVISLSIEPVGGVNGGGGG